MSRRVTVHHFVANLTTTQSGSHPTSNLLGVDYWYDVPADAEFPRTILRMDLFTRFYVQNARPTDFWIRVWWLGSPRRRRGEMIGQFGPFAVPFIRTEAVRDHVFRVSNLQLRGVGRHTVKLVRPVETWEGDRLLILGQTHFLVER